MTATARPALSAQLAPIRARADAATPEPWSMHESLGWSSRGWGRWAVDSDFPEDESNISYAVNTERDAAFIAAARTDVPALLAIIDRLTDALDVAEDCIEAVRIHIDYGYAKGIPGDLRRYDAVKEAMGHE